MATKSSLTYSVNGKITNRQGESLEGMTVRAFDLDIRTRENPLGQPAITDADGRYKISFAENEFKRSKAEKGGPDLYIRVYENGSQVAESDVTRNAARRVTINLQVDSTNLQKPNDAWRVRGIVRNAQNEPLPGIQIHAFDRDLRSEQTLGRALTDKRGFYQIEYLPPQFQARERASADLVIKVYSAEGKILATSSVLFNAPPDAELDVAIPADALAVPALFEKILRELAPLLGDVRTTDLEQNEQYQDVPFLAGEMGLDARVVARFILAHKLRTRELPAEFWFALLGSSIYEYSANTTLAAQQEKFLDALPSLDAAAIHKTLLQSFNLNEISPTFRAGVEKWIEYFSKFVATRAVSDEQASFMKAALERAGVRTAKKQQNFARLFHSYRSLTPELVARLKKDASFSKAQLADLQTSFQLADLTQGDFPLVDAVREQFNVRQPEQIRALAKKSTDEWVSFAKKNFRAEKRRAPIETGEIARGVKMPNAEVYGKFLERQFREAFPTTAFVGGLERALQNGGARGVPRAETLRRFFDSHENFELLNTSVDEFLNNGVNREFRGVARDEKFRLELKAVQRVFKLAPTFEATDALLADKLHSAQQMYRLGESEFVKRYGDQPGFTPETARAAWRRAADTHAAALTIVGDLKSLDANALPRALQTNNQALENFPNWNNLFQGGDVCECEHCRSVLGPAAYFADLLMFLRDRRAKNPAFTVRDILLRRRPDLGYLELNCVNALTTLPYIDVVNEVLEDVVAAGANDLELTGLTFIPADEDTARATIAAEFGAHDIQLSDAFTLTQINSADPNRWIVHDEDATFLFKKKATPNFFAEILRNTHAGAEELRAYPQYVNPKAYEKLRAAKYPFALPFDLFAAHVRAAFRKSNLNRWDLQQTFHGSAAPNNSTEGEIAAEYFRVSTDASAAFDEKRLILVADESEAGQQAVWGESGANWLDAVGNVNTFLAKTNLEYNELLALLDLKFINPNGEIFIAFSDSSCDTAKQTIEGLDSAALDRIHRFLRLWRKLDDWNMWELDLVLRHPRIGNGALDETFLIHLFYFVQLQKRPGRQVTVAQVAGLFGNLNTATRFTKLHERRADALYQNLFLNKKLISPLDPAFQLDATTGDLAAGETISAHQQVVLAALGIRAADLELFQGLEASNGTRYINDDLTLANLSFLWRHAWLARTLKLKPNEWKVLLALAQQDFAEFSSPKTAWLFIDTLDRIKKSGFTFDELNWMLAANRNAKSAPREADAARFLASLRKELQTIRAANDPAQFPFLNSVPPTDVASLTALLTALLQKLNRDETATQFFISTLRDEANIASRVTGLPNGFDFPAAIKNSIRIRYDEPANTLRFTGLMTDAERTMLLNAPSLSVVTSIPAYQEAIAELFTRPRLALKFFDPIFVTPLEALPAVVDFKTLNDPALARKISFDADQRLLRVQGILSQTDRAALYALSNDAAYRSAIDELAAQPGLVALPDERIWLLDADLKFPLRDLNVPANDPLAENLAIATRKALTYLSKTLSENAVVQKSAAELGLDEALTRFVFTHYAVLPDTLLAHLTGAFAATTGVVDYATLKSTFDAWDWANRVAKLLSKWKWTRRELEQMTALTTAAQLLDLLSLPLDDSAPIASLDQFVRTSRLVQLRDSLPETKIPLLDVLAKLNDGAYASVGDFANDVEGLNDVWRAADVEELVNALDLVYPADYLLAEKWERLRRAFYFIENLNAGAQVVKRFAAATMNEVHAQTIQQLLRAKFGNDVWLTLSAEIQDVLREQKRDALAAYLLAQPQPADAPSGKWENTNDLYAYYLLDVEMASCQLTSRLVQASGSIQLFVQRSLMGLEPEVPVQADGEDGDSAWRWWKWMRKYRVWEANRKVFLFPENWIEPELKPDRSSFFKDLENELLQNEVNQYTVETAFQNYLDKLDGVAQLEIAGFYQEDDADETIVHVIGRTVGAEPHLYYYRRFDYRQWTPWEKIEVDIQSEYLIPAVVNKRLFLFWPVFSQVQDEQANSTISTPGANQSNISVQKTVKRHRLHMAMSEHRQGKWTPRQVSKDFYESGWITVVETVPKFYRFLPIDRSEIDGRFVIKFEGYSLGSDGYEQAELHGAFEIGCKGVPELIKSPGNYKPAFQPEWASVGQYVAPAKAYTGFMKWQELGTRDEFGKLVGRHDAPQNDLTLENVFADAKKNPRFTEVLTQTPQIFKMTPPWQFSYFDKLLADGFLALASGIGTELPAPLGSWLPFFYNDQKRTFMVLPVHPVRPLNRLDKLGGEVRYYYPEFKKIFRQREEYFQGQVQMWLDGFDLSALNPDQRQMIERLMSQKFPEEPLPPYTDQELERLMKRFLMRYFHLYLGAQAAQLFPQRRFHFKNFYHPFVCGFTKLVYNPLQGIPALMRRETQLQDSGFRFRQNYQPTFAVVEPGTEELYPNERVDFAPDGAYSPYNWELFYHAPLFIANALSKNQRFEEAREWYHFIFNPLGIESAMPGGSPMSKYWITKPFFETTDPQYLQQRIENILLMLAGNTNTPETKQALEAQVRDWRTHPFEPHRIASYRTVAYQKTVVMKYLDNLIVWGDSLFRQDSMESINEATQLYLLAAEILGPRPKNIPPHVQPPAQTFNELEAQLDTFSNALVEIENLVPPLPGDGANDADAAPLPTLYFCIPQNDTMLRYWDTVADRLFKIRHCMNIEGVVRQLALFEPPIDPGALVKAVAAGVDIGAALADLNAPLPIYRFNILLQKANEVCSDVKMLGGELLAALEKKDAEQLSLLRQRQEIRLLDAITAVRQNQIEEAKENLAALHKSLELAEIRKQFYESREFLNSGEKAALALAAVSLATQTAGTTIDILGSVLANVPDFTAGVSGLGSPHVVTKTGGSNLSKSAELTARSLYQVSNLLDKYGAVSSTVASYQRRMDDWNLQAALANQEMQQLERAMAAAELRQTLAEKELANHLLQIENAHETEAFLRDKFTNQELFQWQVGQIAGVFFRSYQLAYDLAKRAERCFRFELGLHDSSYIQFGYWDSLKKGLLAGEKLQYDLRRLESAYLEQNRREFELVKHVSLLQLDPLALVQLRETGRCFFRVPEELLDLDYPGHYFRRIKSVSLTIPCVVGPYTTISCTLRLLKNSIRINTTNGDNGYARNTDEQGMPADDARFVETNIPVKAIAASNAQNDSGMFEMMFRDERYLPFEGAGAIGEWSLELFNDHSSNNPDFGKPLRQFDYDTITDVILHCKYTAREDAGAFKNAVISHLREYFAQDGAKPGLRLLNLRQEFPGEWYRFLHPNNPANGNVLEFEMTPRLFPLRDADKTLQVNSIMLLARATDAGNYSVVMTPPLPEPPPAASNTFTLARVNQFGSLHFADKETSALGVEIDPSAPPVKWRLTMTRPGGGALEEDPTRKEIEVQDLWLLLGYVWA